MSIKVDRNQKKILLLGLPSTGKTTFIGAFWFYVSSLFPNKSMQLDSLINGEEEYLNKIRDMWTSFQEVPRTLVNPVGNRITMNLKRTSDNQTVVLDAPDFSGETFKSHFETREWEVEYDKSINNLNGLVIFVNPNQENIKPQLLMHAATIESLLGEQSAEAPAESNTSPWTPDLTPAQVKLVEACQFINYHTNNKFPLRIAVVISAWDAVIKALPNNYTPKSWLQAHLPLLFQYLQSNPEIYKPEYFGVSAQGGNYNDAVELADLLIKDPIERFFIHKETEVSNDIAMPILWVTE